MSPSAIEKSIQTAAVSLEMEGFSVDPRCVELCRQLLADEISMEEYLMRVTPKEVWNQNRQ